MMSGVEERGGKASGGHQSVLPEEVLDCLEAARKGRYLDGTFGGGGHTRRILGSHAENFVHGLDRDPEAAARAAAVREEYGARFAFSRGSFCQIESWAAEEWDGILFDLGVSSFQLDEAERGFSFRMDAECDMRMDPDSGIPAWEFLETGGEQELVEAIRDFGEEKFWRRVVRAIIEARGTGKLRRTASLASLIASAIPTRPGKRSPIHPATRSFQGIRISINRELAEISEVLPQAFRLLRPGGRLVVISFHSLEDRLVKRQFREWCGMPVNRDDSRPADERTKLAERVTHKPVAPTGRELAENARSRSARLRALRKL